MTKEDYMELSKERLAELLVERDEELKSYKFPYQPIPPIQIVSQPPCYAPGGICTNPQRDCINCPRLYSGGNYTTTTTNTNLNAK